MDQSNKGPGVLFFLPPADLNLVDWSSGNVLAVALDNSVYLWNAGSGDILQLLQMEQPGDYISSVAWIKEGNYLAVGTSNAEVQVRRVALLSSAPGRSQPSSTLILWSRLSSSGMCSSRNGFGT